MPLHGPPASLIRIAFTLVLLFGSADAALAQDQPIPGTRVRLTLAPGGAPRIVGTLVTIDNVVVTIAPARGEPRNIRRAMIARIERSAGRRSRWPNVVFGALGGAAVGAVAGCASEIGCEDRGEFCLFGAGMAALAGGAIGAGIGAGVGALIPPAERWVVIRF